MENNGKTIQILDGWKVKQYHNAKVDRWYVSFSVNSPLARLTHRHRMLRSHFVWMQENDIWEIPLGFVVHHKDHDRLNDEHGNLQLMTSFDHDKLHRDLSASLGATGFSGRKHTPETLALMREIAGKRGNNDIWDCPKTHHTEQTKALMSDKASGGNNAMFRGDLNSKDITAFYMKCRSLKDTATHFKCSVSAIRYRIDPGSYQIKKLTNGRDRTYRFDDAEMVAFYKKHGAVKAAEKYSCTPATIYYRKRKFENENSIN